MDVKEMMDPLLARFWDETRLRATPGVVPFEAPPSRRELHESWSAVSEALRFGYGERPGVVITRGKNLMRARTTPSAGALYPIEVSVAFKSDDGYQVYEYDVTDGCLRQTKNVEQPEMAVLLAAEDADLPDAVVAVVGRPWKSMHKYGGRGYLYTHLDGAHAATNIALAAEAVGLRPVVHLRFDRHRASDLLGIARSCREPQVFIALTLPKERDAAQVGDHVFALPVVKRADVIATEQLVSEEEQQAWQSVQSVSAFHDLECAPRRFGRSRSIGVRTDKATARPVPLENADRDRAAGFRDMVLSRRSAKGFLPKSVQRADLAGMLAGLRGDMESDCADGPLAGLRVLIRDVDGITPGSYAYQPQPHTLLPFGGDSGLDSAVVEACMGQEVVRSAALLLVLHTPTDSLLGTRGRQGLAELHFHAASAAQRLCLAATETAIGITCLGGFDADRVSDLVRLKQGEEVIYVLACGVPDVTAVKWDRAPVAYSHGKGVS